MTQNKIFLWVASRKGLRRQHKIHFDTRKTCMCSLVFGKESITVIFLTLRGLFEPVVFLLMFCQVDDKTANKSTRHIQGLVSQTSGWAVNAASTQLPRTPYSNCVIVQYPTSHYVTEAKMVNFLFVFSQSLVRKLTVQFFLFFFITLFATCFNNNNKKKKKSILQH